MSDDEYPSTSTISTRAFLRDEGLSCELRLLAGEEGLDRLLDHPRIQKSGLALAAHFHGVVPTRVQILGETEISYLDALDSHARRHALRGYFELGLSCVVVTRAIEPHPDIVEAAVATGTPLVLSMLRSSGTINAIHALLDERLAPRASLHGVLVDVFGCGLLLMGASSIGKSECALDLVMRGHRLVADDVVECDYRPPGMIFGQAADLLRHHIEIRGLGVLDIKDMFGVTAIRERKRIDVVVKLVEWDADTEYDRMGIDDRHHEILGVPIRELTLPVRPGRNMSSIVEIAARNQLLRDAGRHAAREFFERIEGKLMPRTAMNESESLVPPVVRPTQPGDRA